MREVARALGVRVQTMNPLKCGKVALLVPFEKERKKVVEHPKFSVHELEATVAQKLGTRAVVYDVYCFMRIIWQTRFSPRSSRTKRRLLAAQ